MSENKKKINLVVFRYSPRVIDFKYADQDKTIMLTLESQKEKYAKYMEETNLNFNVIYLDSFELDNLLIEIEKIRQSYNIQNIFTLSEDDMDIVGFINELIFGKKYNFIENSVFKNKYLMRASLKTKINQPNFKVLQSIDSIRSFKSDKKSLIIKPVNAASSIGIKKIRREQLSEIKVVPGTLVEECIEHDLMITCDGYAIGNQIKRFFVHEYDKPVLESLSGKGEMIIKTSSLYNDNMGLIYKVFEECQKIINLLVKTKDFIPFHFEFFIEKETQEIYFCEVAKRFGGGCIPSLVKYSYDINLLKEYWEFVNYGSIKNIEHDKVLMPNLISASYSPYKTKGKVIKVPEKLVGEWIKNLWVFVSEKQIIEQDASSIVDNFLVCEFTASSEQEFKKNIRVLKEFKNNIKMEPLN